MEMVITDLSALLVHSGHRYLLERPRDHGCGRAGPSAVDIVDLPKSFECVALQTDGTRAGHLPVAGVDPDEAAVAALAEAPDGRNGLSRADLNDHKPAINEQFREEC